MQYYVLYAISGGHYCIRNNVLRTDGFAYAIVSARTLLHNAILSARTHLHMQLCPPTCKTVAPDTIAYAKVSGADSIAWRTQLHLTPVRHTNVKINHDCFTF